MPSKRPQTIRGPGPAASSITRDWVNGRRRADKNRRGAGRFPASVRAAAVVGLELREDRRVVEALLGRIEIREEVLLLVARDVDRGGQPVVVDRDEPVVSLELERDRLDQRALLEGVQDPAPDRLDDVEELFGVHLLVANQEQVGEDVVV